MTDRQVARGPNVSEAEARAILARHGIPWDGPIKPRSNHALPYRAMDLNVVPVVRFDGQPLTTEQVEVLRRMYSPDQLEKLAAWFRTSVEALGTAFRNIQDTMRTMGLAMDPGEQHDDPRARALAARRNRNTGPARPSAAAARRPRRHQ